jgi:hypothetical protein
MHAIVNTKFTKVMLLSKEMANSPETTGLINQTVEGKDRSMSQPCVTERENHENGPQSHADLVAHASSTVNAVEAQKTANDEPAAKRQRLDVETGSEPAPAQAVETSTSQEEQRGKFRWKTIFAYSCQVTLTIYHLPIFATHLQR